LSYNQINME